MKRWWIAPAAVAAGAALWLLWPHETDREESAAQGGAAAGAPATAQRPSVAGSAPQIVSGAGGSAVTPATGTPGTTPPLERAATARDGFVEVRVTAQGKPAAGARVRLYLHGPLDLATRQSDWRFAGLADTGKDGLARLAAGPGGYLAVARAPSFAPARREFHRALGEPTTRIALDLVSGVSIAGRTVQKGSPLESVPLALVTLTPDASPLPGRGPPGMFRPRRADAPAEEEVRTTADEHGRFRADGLTPGTYRATAYSPGYAKATARADAPGTKELTLEMVASAFIEGHVVAADGKAASGAEVYAVGGGETAAATATDTGTFSLEVSPRSWNLAARRGDESGRADAPVSVVAGATARGVKIALGSAAGIAGTVVAAVSQQPLLGATVAVAPRGQSGDAGRAVTDPAGTFAVGGLPPGSYDVAVNAEGYSSVMRNGITVDNGQRFPLRIELHATGSVEGAVRDAAGRSVSYALVRGATAGFFRGGAPVDQPPEARTDDSGAYRLSGVAPGRATFTAMRDGAALGTQQGADVPEGGVARLDFQLKDEGIVTGKVRKQDGTPPPAGTTVRAMTAQPRAAGMDWAPVPVDAAGSYIVSLPAGSYTLMAGGQTGPGSFRNRTFVTVEAGKTAQMDLTYLDAAQDATGFSGTVLEPGGAPSPAAWVNGFSQRDRFPVGMGMNTDENGRFHLDRPRTDLPDAFDVSAINGGRTGKTAVQPGQTEVVIQLLPSATLRGHLSAGKVDSFQVDLAPTRDSDFPGFAARSSLEFTGDRFEVRDLPGSKMHVSVRTSDGRSAQLDVTLTPGAAQDVEVPLQDNAAVSGRLVDSATKQPLPDVRLFVDRSISPDAGNVTGGDGRFRLSSGGGDHTVRFMLPQGYKQLTRSFTLQAAQQLDLGDVAAEKQGADPGTIGIRLRSDSESLPLVIFVLPDSPADKAGVHIGDQVIAVDGAPVKGWADATQRIKGAPGTPVQLTIRRNGTEEQTLTVTRAS